jgi:CRP-like cAMP-binding protein
MTAHAEHLAVIAQADIFHNLDTPALRSVMAYAVAAHYQEGEFVFYQDDPAERVYVLAEGRLRLLQLTPEGAQINMGLVSPGQAIAVISLLEAQRYPVSAQAIGSALVLSWSRRDLHHLMIGCPQIALNALQELSQRMIEFQDRLRELTTERVERRIARGLLRLARQAGRKTEQGVLIDLPVSRQDLAEMTGTTLFTVSRTLSQWEERGIISAGRERILIRFPHGLVTIAEDLPAPHPPPSEKPSDSQV